MTQRLTATHNEPIDLTIVYEAYDYPDLVIADGCGFVHFFNNHMDPPVFDTEVSIERMR